jgi:hypothetical protein
MKAPLALIVNQSMARRYWPNEDALGKRVAIDDHPKVEDWMTVVGIVGDVKDKPDSPTAEMALWWPIEQSPVGVNNNMAVVMRGSSDPALLANDCGKPCVSSIPPSPSPTSVRWTISRTPTSPLRVSPCSWWRCSPGSP